MTPPVTVPPVVVPPTVPPVTVPVIRPDFTVSTDSVSRTARPGERVVVRVSIVRRSNWTGPVRLVLDGQPTVAGVGFLPSNPTPDQVSDLHIVLPSGTPLGDYTLRITGRAGDGPNEVVRQAAMVLRVVGDERVNLAIASGGTVAAGTTGRFGEIEATVTNGSGAVTLSAEGLPAGITLAVGQNPLSGRAPLFATVAPGVANGPYSFVIVGSTPFAQTRITASLVVGAASSSGNATLSYSVTPVTPVPGDALGYGLGANTSALTIARGTTGQLLLTITPRGGFTGVVDVDVSGLPAGVVPTLQPTGTPTSSR